MKYIFVRLHVTGSGVWSKRFGGGGGKGGARPSSGGGGSLEDNVFFPSHSLCTIKIQMGGAMM